MSQESAGVVTSRCSTNSMMVIGRNTVIEEEPRWEELLLDIFKAVRPEYTTSSAMYW